ncbi:uncharacterized protein L969DRAFT_93002 [Mixia osmundae IAM 14324]|uniref:uncharacterized protein n=1 Tax=Mixia osmundae (strain CBS 9802 / IAM 14324 / JCM 22182 / KY 12970) TaxID=764103 RepID=UPI0004A5475E|nr:uncharacterized protein L969DRAFT_93002 [Mixia osmundae IAM 14324]KEI41785.1 hypothetical protein L969DRAFT_93002 [Mixia osmundae IAM 14324]
MADQKQSLAPGWTEHFSPKGVPYYYNAETKKSTYTRPVSVLPTVTPDKPLHLGSSQPVAQPDRVKRKKEKPLTKTPIAGNVFYTHSEHKTSVWTAPEEISGQVARLEAEEKEARYNGTPLTAITEPVTSTSRSATATSTAPPAKRTPDETAPGVSKKSKRVHALADLDIESQQKVASELAALDANEGASLGPPPASATDELSSDENKALFRSMLAETDISPLAPWDMELPKFVNDPRYKAVKQLRERRELFDDFCKEKIRAQRARGAAPKQDPIAAYRALLVAHVTSTRTHWDDFRRDHKTDVRFRNYGRDDREREKAFRSWLKDLGELKRADAEQAQQAFDRLLTEQTDLTPASKWVDVKGRLSVDPRYDAIKSASTREASFKAHLQRLAEAPLESVQERAAAKAERARASLLARQHEVEAHQAQTNQVVHASRQKLATEEAERSFKAVLIDNIRDPSISWPEAVETMTFDKRYEECCRILSLEERRRAWSTHVAEVHAKWLDGLHTLFEQNAPFLDTPFLSILPKIYDHPLATRVSSDADKLEHLFCDWQQFRQARARTDFDRMLGESAFVDFWGRMSKESADEGDVKRILDDDLVNVEESGDASVSLKAMAATINLDSIHSVLQSDRRYRAFDHEPEAREQWMRDYLSRLSAPAATVHQRQS